MELAREFSLPVISADAYQCYRMMNIGTDKPSRKEVEGIPYYFYDEYEPDEDVSVFTFQSRMRPILMQYQKEGKDVLLVGGTFLYVKALLYPYVFPKEETKSPYEEMPLEEMQELLKKKSMETYSAIDYRNPRRVKRALDLLDLGLSPKKVREENEGKPLYPVRFFSLTIDKEEGNRKIDSRVDRMFASGFLDEAKTLLSRYPEKTRSLLAIGYPEVREGLREGESEEEIKNLIKIHTHQYAKKQRTFLRHQFEGIVEGDRQTICSLLRKELESQR